MSDIENIEDPIELELQEDALNLAKKKARWNGAKSILSPIAVAASKLEITPRLTGSGLEIYFSGDKDKLTKALRILRTAGFSTDADRPEAGKTEWYAWFHNPACSLKIWFHFVSSVCKQVKVGTRMQEVDVYEVQCGETNTLDGIAASGVLSAPEESPPALEHVSG